MTHEWIDEIQGLHEFFQTWFRGEVENSDSVFRRCAEALADDFIMVETSGKITPHNDVLESVRKAHGTHPDITIRVADLALRGTFSDGTMVVTYEEWQEAESQMTGRTSTALLRPFEKAPTGLEWLHLHETWLQPPEQE